MEIIISLLNGIYNFKVPINLNKNVEDHPSTRQNEQIMIPKTRTKKADEHFLKRASHLLK